VVHQWSLKIHSEVHHTCWRVAEWLQPAEEVDVAPEWPPLDQLLGQEQSVKQQEQGKQQLREEGGL